MRSRRLFVDTALAIGMEVTLDERGFQHMIKVLRLVPGDKVRLFNGQGGEYVARLANVERRRASVCVLSFEDLESESRVRLVLAQGLSRADRMDYALQKATELGVARVVPLVTQRTQGRPAQAQRKQQHWRGVVISACEQCGRNRLPEIAALTFYTDWLRGAEHQPGTGLLLDPRADKTLSDVPPPEPPLTLVVGPEGGFDDDEIASGSAAGLIPVRLGPRVLRTETATTAALAAVQTLWGDFN